MFSMVVTQVISFRATLISTVWTLIFAQTSQALSPQIQYDQYKLVRMFTSGVQDQRALYDYLIPSKSNVSSYRSTVSNKNTHLADFETCLFRGYLRNHLSCRKVFNIYLHPCLKSFQMTK